jgi:hypothetical protein
MNKKILLNFAALFLLLISINFTFAEIASKKINSSDHPTLCAEISPPYCPNGKLVSHGVNEYGCGLPSTCEDSDCKNLYWFDSASKECGYKEFCGLYMYQGLRTFETKDECNKELNSNVKENEISEKITCKFEETKKEQKCYTAYENERAFCSGIESCKTEINGYKGENITWKSSCGGYQYTTQDGNDEVIYFKCAEGETDINEIKNKGFRNVYFQCYDGEESKSTDREACKTAEFWKKFAENFCQSHCAKKGDIEKCGVNSFSLTEECYVEEDKSLICKKGEDVQICCKKWADENNIFLPDCVGKWKLEDDKCVYKCSQETETNATEETSENKILICKDSCPLDGKCYPFGYRKETKYCSDRGSFEEQFKSDETCENNFECSSNVCVSGKCIDEGFLKKIMNWFKKLFG